MRRDCRIRSCFVWLGTLLLATAAVGCNRLAGGSGDGVSGRGGKPAGQLGPGFLSAGQAPSPPVHSMATPPPPLNTTDPATVTPAQPENVVYRATRTEQE